MSLESNYYRDVMLRLRNHKELADGAEKMKNEMLTVLRQLFEVTPAERNFEVKIEENREIDLTLERADGYTVSLNTLLPENAQFWKSEGFWCSGTLSGTKLVGFAPNQLQYRGGLLVLAHEMGHAHQQSSINPHLMVDSNNVEKRENLHRMISQNERGAWAFALHTLRRLEKSGFNVFAGFRSRREVQEFITCSLLTYEGRRMSSLLEIGGQPALDKARPIFVKGQTFGDREKPGIMRLK